ncbi:MAG: hypothetical protein PHV97_01150 [Candidatus Omnitrophica bacterium]|nr:hypothetical protein [Candidatus Omnitrophota bacterium]
MKIRKFKEAAFFWILAASFLLPAGGVFAQEPAETAKKTEAPTPKSDLDNLKAEWEAVREQQIQMIREKEDQLEKLKEEIFAKMKVLNAPPAQGNSSELEAQKASLQAERQKFFSEMSRQKESLRKLQSSLDEKAKQLEADRARFEQEKKTAAR